MSKTRAMSLTFPVLLAIFSFVASGPALSQSTSVLLGSGVEIPVLDQTSITIDRNGRLAADCVLFASACQGVNDAGTPGGPNVVLMRLNGGNSAAPGASIALAWVVQGEASVCLAGSTPPVPGWNDNAVQPGVGQFLFNVGATGVYRLSLRCYGSEGQSNLATYTVNVGVPTKLQDITDMSWIAGPKALQKTIALDRYEGTTWHSCSDAASISFSAKFGRFWSLSYTCASDASQSTSGCRVAEMQYMPEPGPDYDNRLLAADCNGPQPPFFFSGFE